MGTMILCAPNGNAIEGLEPTDIIEVTCDISREAASRTISRTFRRATSK